MGVLGTALQVGMTARENAKQRAFAERMSNTAYQRTMKDMREAGLNPLLAYQKGGASTPTAGGTGFKSDIDIAGTAMQIAQTRENVKNTRQNTATAKEQAELTHQQTNTEETKQALNRDNALDARSRAAINVQEYHTGKNVADRAKTQGGKYLGWARELRDSLTPWPTGGRRR